jgi:hypothetical protein
MSKPLTPKQVSAAMRFYAIALTPPGVPKPSPFAERDQKQHASTPPRPINPEPKDDRP